MSPSCGPLKYFINSVTLKLTRLVATSMFPSTHVGPKLEKKQAWKMNKWWGKKSTWKTEGQRSTRLQLKALYWFLETFRRHSDKLISEWHV